MMITESELEAQAITWFQDSGWEFRHGPRIAPQVPAGKQDEAIRLVLEQAERLSDDWTKNGVNP